MILVHHLRIGRSVFTVWFLEELGVEYGLKIYTRGETGRAPAELKNAHPLGKSPVIEDGNLTLAESGAIAVYMMENHDPDGKFAPPTDKSERAEWTQWLHYSEASGFAPLLLKLLLMRSPDPKPALIDAFATAEVALQLNYIQDFLGDKPFILGDKRTAPDFGICYMLNMAKMLGELGPYPALDTYLKRNLESDSFKRAMERTGG
jgi:glutathione S-transferase